MTIILAHRANLAGPEPATENSLAAPEVGEFFPKKFDLQKQIVTPA